MTEIEFQLEIARIWQLHAEAEKYNAERLKLITEERWWPYGILFQAMTATAGLLGAGVLIGKFFFK
jgi:hypothetical protein